MKIHNGLLGIAFSILMGLGYYHMTVADLLRLFPLKLFFILLGVTSFFSALERNGTILRWVELLRRLSSEKFVPLLMSLFVGAVTFAGLGNISSIGLVAPMALPMAKALGLSPLVMSISVVSAANAASMSPLSLGGIVTKTLLEGSSFNDADSWRISFIVLGIQIAIAISGWFLLGGTQWFQQLKSKSKTCSEVTPWGRQHYISTVFFLAFAAILGLGGIAPQLFQSHFLLKTLSQEPGLLGFVALAGLMLTKSLQDPEQVIARVSWSTIVLVCGMTFALQLLESKGAFLGIVAWLGEFHSPILLIFTLGFSAGLLSTFSSSVGVVLPLFLPVVVGIASSTPEIPLWYYVATVGSCAHVVDASPFSTLGALCIAQIESEDVRRRTSKSLLVWGLCLAPISALIFALGSLLF